jgi:hypothetical protein
MNTTLTRKSAAATIRRIAMRAAIAGALTVAMTAIAAAAPPVAEKPAAKPAPKLLPAGDADLAARWLPMLAAVGLPKLEGLVKPEHVGLLSTDMCRIADNVAKLLTGNRDNEAILKPFSENVAEILSGNETELDVDTDQEANLLSHNPESQIDIEPFSENDVEVLSGNRAELFSGNTSKLFSDVNLLSGINVSITINVQNGGEHPHARGPDGIESAFRRLDRNGDGKITIEEFRAVMSCN